MQWFGGLVLCSSRREVGLRGGWFSFCSWTCAGLSRILHLLLFLVDPHYVKPSLNLQDTSVPFMSLIERKRKRWLLTGIRAWLAGCSFFFFTNISV